MTFQSSELPTQSHCHYYLKSTERFRADSEIPPKCRP
jgi:hypothetical protein